MAEKLGRKLASEQDEELKKIRELKRKASEEAAARGMTRGMTTPQGQLLQAPSTVPKMDPLLLQARNRNWRNTMAAFIEEIEKRAGGISSSARWNRLKTNFLKVVETAPPWVDHLLLRKMYDPMDTYLAGWCDAKGIKEEDLNKGLTVDRYGLPVLLQPKKPGEDPEVK